MDGDCTHESHEELKRSPGMFRLLAFVGFWPIEGRCLELRNCLRCGSTLAVKQATIPPKG